jgi:hypothetical protein
VERVSRTTSTLFDPSTISEDTLFDPTPLLQAFEKQIDQLWILYDDISRETALREEICRKKEEEHKRNMESLETVMQVCPMR